MHVTVLLPRHYVQYKCYVFHFQVTDVVAIRASGSLLCEYVIYIVTPRLTSSYSLEKTGSELCKAFKNVLKYANEKLRLKSIAVPSIGTGVYNPLFDLL